MHVDPSMYKICIYCFLKALLVVQKCQVFFLYLAFLVLFDFFMVDLAFFAYDYNWQPCGSMYEILNTEIIMNIFIRSSRNPKKKGKQPPWGRGPQVANH